MYETTEISYREVAKSLGMSNPSLIFNWRPTTLKKGVDSLSNETIFKDNDSFKSMSRKGNCYDNSPMVSFFGHMRDVVLPERSETLHDLCYAVEAYIKFYNNHRYQKKLKKMTPTAYRDHLLWPV